MARDFLEVKNINNFWLPQNSLSQGPAELVPDEGLGYVTVAPERRVEEELAEILGI